MTTTSNSKSKNNLGDGVHGGVDGFVGGMKIVRQEKEKKNYENYKSNIIYL